MPVRGQTINLIGQRFGRLVVLNRAERRGGKWFWTCQCDCGNVANSSGCNLRTGHIRSCGCLRDESRIKHGLCGTPEYFIWRAMIDRCENPKDAGFKNYGGRDIAVCDKWHDFACFIADVGRRPDPELSIERDDNDGNYEPGNCRWATRTEQSRHTRKHSTNTSGITGVSWREEYKKWRAFIHENGKTIHLGHFNDISEATAARRSAEAAMGYHPKHGR